MGAASAIVQTDILARERLVARKALHRDNYRCLAVGAIAPSCLLVLKQNGAAMPGTPLPPSSPLSIEPISMRIPDACRFTGISRSTLYLLIARGEVEVVKMGAATLVLTESLRRLIERSRCNTPYLKPPLTGMAPSRHAQTIRPIAE